MDLDAFVATHHPTWRRLEDLAGRSPQTGAQADELVDLYRQVATHLSILRAEAPDPSTISYLSGVLARARITSVGTRASTWRGFAEYFTRRLPAALYLNRRWWMSTMLISYLIAALVAWWLLEHPQVESTLLTQQQVKDLVEHEFADYYKQAAAGNFAAKVWTNNAWVAAQCIAFGVFGLPVLYVLASNMLNLAVVGSVMIRHDRASLFFGLILPHGLLELTAVFVAAGTGLRLFWAWVRPGPVPRSTALAREGRAAAAISIGLVVVLLISGIIEGFVTPSGLPTWARILIGVIAEVGFLGYVYLIGRRAARDGWTGDVDADLLEARVAHAA